MKRFVSSSSHLVVAASLCRGVHRVMHSTVTPATAGKLCHGYSALLLLFLASPLHAQVGNNNPTGVSGIFNGLITTGCSYDPFTGNATRSLVDISVAAAVGGYPLALVRTTNSRGPSATGVFGQSGGWNHSYNWMLEDSETSTFINFRPSAYTVDFPDGRSEVFQSVTWDSNFRVRAIVGGNTTSAGVRDRLVPLYTGPNNLLAYLILPDGGEVEFQATQHSLCNQWGCLYWYTYKATAIIDPYGLRTQFVYELTPNGTRRLQQVTEPAGRWLHFYYTGTNSRTLDHVTASDGRTVQYNYTTIAPGGTTYTALTSINYFGQSQWTALYRYRIPNIAPYSGVPLLWTCDEPMYPGPMKRIAYDYKTGTPQDPIVYGQILSERYYDGATIGVAVSTLTAPSVRTETRADGGTRTFSYSTGGYLQSCTDFMSHPAQQGYDTKKYINSVTDFNQHTTNYTNDPITGNVTQVQFPATADVTPSPAPRGTVSYTYGSANCADPNNRDANNPYYACTATDEGGHVTQFWRDTNKRVTRIDYPDGGYETFGYDASHFYQLSSHRMVTGGTETFTYNGRAGLKDTYRNPDTASGNPTARYQYDAHDRVSDVTDVLGQTLGDPDHTTSFSYNLRGHLGVTTFPTDPVDGQRHHTTNWYNPDGTMSASQNELYQTTSYTYDDYRRLKSVTPPARGWNDTSPHVTYFYYGANPSDNVNDYKLTDPDATWVIFPSGKQTKTIYDDNRRKSTVIVGYGTGDAATTTYSYDNVGNVTSVIAPSEQPGQPFNGESTTTAYDERNRPSSITDALSRTTSFTYDRAGRKKTITRPNNQVITYVTYDEMNRVAQQSATNQGTTKYTYYPGSGLLETMQDPHLVAINSADTYSYTYDGMGRKRTLTYPLDSGGVHRVESFTYDNAGRLWKFTNRAGKLQTFSYDALNRMTGFTWNDGSTPSVSFSYDVASRLIEIDNANATISRGYFYDNLLRAETETVTGGGARTVTYTYDTDGNRGTLSIPGYSFSYDYTNRNQVKTITDNGSNIISSFWYDKNGNVVQRNPGNGTTSSYTPDALDRITQIVHTLTGGATRTFNYGYYPNSNNRKWTQRLIVPNSSEHNRGEVFGYDLADQVTAVQLNIANPNTTDPGDPSIIYDSNGNRIWYAPPGVNKHYDGLSNLSEYTHVVINSSQYNLTYEAAANLAQYDRNNSSYNYDAQNRLTTSTVNGKTMTFKYDGLNRQVSRQVGNGTTYYSTWDGWDLVEDYHGNGVADATYLYGPTGLVKNLRTNNYYYQDGSGSTALLASSNGTLREWYRYDLDGAPFFYNPNDTQRNPNQSGYGVRHLFTGQQWYSEVGLYDLRNRFYSPDIGRFLQPDPIGFAGDPTNLYRYCANNPLRYYDPTGLWQFTAFGGRAWGVLLTLGYNSGQWNYGLFGGVGGGLAFGLNLSDSGFHPMGTSLNATGTTGWGNGIFGARLGFNVGGAGNTGSVTGRAGPFSGGIVVNSDTGKTSLTGPSLTASLASPAGFGGVGFMSYGPRPLQGQPAAQYALPGQLDYGGYYDQYGDIVWEDSVSVVGTVPEVGQTTSADSDSQVLTLPPVVVSASPIGGTGFSPADLGYSGPLSGLGLIGEYFDFYSPGWFPKPPQEE